MGRNENQKIILETVALPEQSLKLYEESIEIII